MHQRCELWKCGAAAILIVVFRRGMNSEGANVVQQTGWVDGICPSRTDGWLETRPQVALGVGRGLCLGSSRNPSRTTREHFKGPEHYHFYVDFV